MCAKDNSVGNIVLGFVAKTDKFEKDLERVQKKVSKFGNNLVAIGKTLSTSVTLPILGMGAAFVKAAADMEQTQVQFNALVGNMAKTKKFLGELQELEKNSPFSFPELKQASQNLLALTGSLEQTKALLQGFGDIAAGTGNDINTITDAFTKMQVAGVVTMKDISSATKQGIPIIDALAISLGKSKAEILDLVRKGKISAADINDAFKVMATSSDFFKGKMAELDNTFSGTIGDIVSILKEVSIELGQVVISSLGLKEISIWVNGAAEAFKAWLKETRETNPELLTTIVRIAAIAAAVGPVILALGALAKTFALGIGVASAFFGALISPWALFGASIVAAGAVLLTFFDGASTDGNSFGQNMVKVFEDIRDNGAKMLELALNDLYIKWLKVKHAFQWGEDAEATRQLIAGAEQAQVDILNNVKPAAYSGANLKTYSGLSGMNKSIDSYIKKIEEANKASQVSTNDIGNAIDELAKSTDSSMTDFSASIDDATIKLQGSVDTQTAALERLKDHGFLPLKESARDLSVGISKSMNESVKSVVMGTSSISDAFENMMNRIVTSISNAIYDQTVGNMITKLVGGMNIDGLFEGIFGGGGSDIGIVGGGFGGGYSGFFDGGQSGFSFGDAFSGFGFADGGRPPLGKASLVGEEGPELFVPDSAGTIIPNGASMAALGALGSGQSITVIQNISITPDIPSTTRRVIFEELPMIKEAAARGVEEKVLQGGKYSRNIRGN